MLARLLLCTLKLAKRWELATQDQLHRVQDGLKLEREFNLAKANSKNMLSWCLELADKHLQIMAYHYAKLRKHGP